MPIKATIAIVSHKLSMLPDIANLVVEIFAIKEEICANQKRAWYRGSTREIRPNEQTNDFYLSLSIDLDWTYCMHNRPFSYSGKESESNDVVMQLEEFSNVHNGDRSSNATRSSLAYEIV